MLLNFSVENWRSFRDQADFSMIASRERQHGSRVAQLAKHRTRVLPVAAIYGGNASGKTNLFHALNFVRNMVVQGTHPDDSIPVRAFRLDDSSPMRPSRFAIELLVGDVMYAFSFEATSEAILEERLTEITSTSEKTLYHRIGKEMRFGEPWRRDQFLQFAFRGTRGNQLFLTNSVSQDIEHFRPVYDWFKEQLILIAPDTRFRPFNRFIDEHDPLYAAMNELLPQLDTGIVRLGSEEVPFENLPFSDALKEELRKDAKAGEDALVGGASGDRYAITRAGEGLVAKKLCAYHAKPDGEEVWFDLRDESDGSRRILDLLPAFVGLTSQSHPQVCVVDEIDRSLHPILIMQMIENYLLSCSAATRSQLLLTTHNTYLMDQQLFRRDEMWLTERDADGASTLRSISEYKDVRFDKDIRKSYLLGHLGGIPHVALTGAPDAFGEAGKPGGRPDAH